MKRILAFTILLFSLFSQKTYSGSIQVAQWLPWSFVSQEFTSTPIDVHVTQAENLLSWQEITPKIVGLEFQLKGNFTGMVMNHSGIKASSENLNAVIKIDSIVFDQIIHREFGGNTIDVRVKSVCSGISLIIPNFKASFSSSFVPSASGYAPKLSGADIDFSQSAWKMPTINCQGVDGLGDEISSQIAASLNDPASLKTLLLPWLSAKVEDYWLASWDKLLLATGDALHILSIEAPSDKGLIILAELPIKADKTIPLIVDQSILSNNIPQFILNQNGMKALMEDKFFDLAPKKYDLRQVDAFKQLLGSRVKQYVAWPDLNRFNTSTPFLLTLDPNQSKLLLSSTKVKNEWQAHLNGNGVLQVAIGGSPIDYINFGIVTDTTLKFKVEKSLLTLSTGTVSLNMAWNFALLYNMIFNPNKRIAVDILKSSVASAFSNQTVNMNLPVLKWQEREWKLGNWKETNDFITMDWAE
jgi:hypothetical protein